jgi:hypothetical protein
MVAAMRIVAVVVGAAGLLVARPAAAVDPFEIQVYEGDINDPLQPGLELHSNFVASGHGAAAPGEVGSHHQWRETLEPSFGVLSWWELGAYLQLLVAVGEGEAHFGGYKLRSKFVVPRRLTGDFVLGLNFEVGRGTEAFGGADWDSEVRPILVWAPPRWLIAVNPILGWAVTGERHAAPDFEPCAKVRWDTGRGVGVGVEYYAGLGALSQIEPRSQQQHILYLAADLVDSSFELNAGVGRGLSEASDPWTVKVILGRAF